MNVLDAIKTFFPALKITRKTSDEWGAPCPSCGGKDRFTLWAEKDADKGGRFWCRGCGARGDAIAFLMSFCGLDYRGACEWLGTRPKGERSFPALQKRNTPETWTPKDADLPSDKWRSAAAELVEHYAPFIEHGAGLAALQARGLSVETARALGLGWVEHDAYFQLSNFGLPETLNKNGNPSKLFLPAGLLMPIQRKEGWVALVVRRSGECKPHERFWQIRGGSKDLPLVLGERGKPVMILESFLDAALVWQEAGDAVSVVALNGSAKIPAGAVFTFLMQAPLRLGAFDNDGAGLEALAEWQKHFPNPVKKWFTPSRYGKDAGDAWRNGMPIRKWVLLGLKQYGAISENDTNAPTPEPSFPAGQGEQPTPWVPCSDLCRDCGAACLACQNLVGIEEGRQCFSCLLWAAGRGSGQGYFDGTCLKDMGAAHMMMPCRWGSVAEDELLLSC